MSIGMDPDIAVQVARGEGLAPDTWQSNLQQPYGREQSYGDFQLHFDPTGKRPGLGNEFLEKTGLDVSNPANWFEMNKFAMNKAKELGWSPWMGAKAKGITGFMGIGGRPAEPAMVAYNTDDTPAMGAAMGGFASGPGDVQARMETGTVAGLLDEEPLVAGYDIADFAKLGGKIIERAKRNSTPQEQELLKPQVLQPLQRYTLEGLL